MAEISHLKNFANAFAKLQDANPPPPPFKRSLFSLPKTVSFTFTRYSQLVEREYAFSFFKIISTVLPYMIRDMDI